MRTDAHRWLAPALLACFVAGGSSLPAFAADPSPPANTAAAAKLAPARALIKDGRWREAIDALQQVSDPTSADWNNLMGYSHRKAKVPDLDASERYYNEALRIDPGHRGALEYSGELYLVKGDLARAEARLKTLDKACFFGCEEFTDLKEAVARFKANGNRYQAKP